MSDQVGEHLIYLLDTNAVSDLMAEEASILARIAERHVDRIRTSVIVIGELRYGTERLHAGKKKSSLESKLADIEPALRPLPFRRRYARGYAILRHQCVAGGIAIDDNDLWIAATAMAIGATVVTRDADFSRFAGVQVENWMA